MDYKNQYRTNNLGLATALVTAGAVLVEVERTTPTRASFVFENNDRLEALINGYWNKSLNVPALAYFDTIKQMKSRLYS